MSIHRRIRSGALVVAVGLIAAATSVGVAAGQGIPPAQAVDDTAVALMDTPLNVAAPGVLANDQILATEPGAPSYSTCPAEPGASTSSTPGLWSLAPRIVTNAGEGTLTLQLTGSYSFVPAAGFVGTTTFAYSLANIDEDPQCPIAARVRATLTIQVVATAEGSFDGTFTPVAVQTGPCILVDTTTIAFGDVAVGSTAWAAPSAGRTTIMSSCAAVDQVVSATVSNAIGGGSGSSAVSLEPSANTTPLINQFSFGVATRDASAGRPGAPTQILSTIASGVAALPQGTAGTTIEHYLIAPAAGTPAAGTGFRFAVTFVATARS